MSGASTAFGRHLLVAVDAVGYSKGNDQAHLAVQAALPKVLSTAARHAKLDRGTWRLQQQGDGQLAILPHDQPEPAVVDDFARHLAQALATHNAKTAPDHRLRLRMAIHCGTAVEADNGYAGQGVVAVCRLVDSDPVRDALAELPEADLAVILSHQVFVDTVRGGYVSFAESDFTPVRVRVKEFSDQAWVTVLSGPASRPTPPRAQDARHDQDARDGTREADNIGELASAHVNNIFTRDVDARGATFGISYSPRDGSLW